MYVLELERGVAVAYPSFQGLKGVRPQVKKRLGKDGLLVDRPEQKTQLPWWYLSERATNKSVGEGAAAAESSMYLSRDVG